MSDKFKQYTSRQKSFWNVADKKSAKFERIFLNEEKSETAWIDSAVKAAKFLTTDIEPKENWIILEIGCGVGRIINYLREYIKFHRIIGVDISESMIEYAKKDLDIDKRIEFHVNSGYDLSMISSDTIDFVYSVDVFIHIYDVDIILNYLREVKRVLKDGGIVRFNLRYLDLDIAFKNSLGGIFAKFMYQFGFWSAGWHKWDKSQQAEFNGNEFMSRDIHKLARECGLAILEINVDSPHVWCTMKKT